MDKVHLCHNFLAGQFPSWWDQTFFVDFTFYHNGETETQREKETYLRIPGYKKPRLLPKAASTKNTVALSLDGKRNGLESQR